MVEREFHEAIQEFYKQKNVQGPTKDAQDIFLCYGYANPLARNVAQANLRILFLDLSKNMTTVPAHVQTPDYKANIPAQTSFPFEANNGTPQGLLVHTSNPHAVDYITEKLGKPLFTRTIKTQALAA